MPRALVDAPTLRLTRSLRGVEGAPPPEAAGGDAEPDDVPDMPSIPMEVQLPQVADHEQSETEYQSDDPDRLVPLGANANRATRRRGAARGGNDR